MLSLTYGYPILTAAQTRALDESVEKDYGLPLAVLMENAGRAVACAVEEREPALIVAAVGAGNNGGDALVAARILKDRGYRVKAALTRPGKELEGLAALAWRRYVDAGGETTDASSVDWDACDVVIDGLLGTGLRGSPRPGVAEVIRAINASRARVVAVDVPSGLDSDSASAPECAVRADVTVALACYKPCHVHFPAAEWSGAVRLADIGVPPSLLPPNPPVVLGAAAVRRLLPCWGRETHKGARGRVAVVAGSRGMCGAAAMACVAAANSGAGLVYLANPEGLTPVFEVKLTETVLHPVPDIGAQRYTPESLDGVLATLAGADAAVIGPGIGQDPRTAAFVQSLLPRLDRPAVIDADALNIIATCGLTVPPNVVLTPHPGEMARLLGTGIGDVQADRLPAALQAASKFGCPVLLKGAHTVVAAPDGRAVVNTVSAPVLATAGSGDVLSGIIGSLLGQGVAPFEAALVGARWHGTAGVLAASKWGGTLGATEFLRWLSPAREEMLEDVDEEILV
jgi:NAD(P)H-hydrate epimerase